MSKITYHLRYEKKVNGFLCRNYVARLNDMTPVDAFTLFYSCTQWTAWTGDTINGKLKHARNKFAAKLNQTPP